MSNRWVKINANLKKCRKIAEMLKQKNPWEVMPINCLCQQLQTQSSLCEYHSITIAVYRKDSKVCWRNGREMSNNAIAHAHQFPPLAVCIRQEYLLDPWSVGTKKGKGSWSPRYNVPKSGSSALMFGNWSLIELLCHELGHFMGSDNNNIHGKKWYNLFQKFLRQMAQEVISGNYYKVIN